MNQVDFYFDKLSRMGSDPTVKTQDNLMNTNHANYMLYNPYSSDCDAALNFATNQPFVFMKGTYQVGPQGCNIMESNDLERSINTNPNIKISLHERPYKTVPFLGRGNVDVAKENALFWGDTLRERKSVCQLGETQYINLGSYPLHNDGTHVREVMDTTWMNGVDSREMYRGKEYSKK